MQVTLVGSNLRGLGETEAELTALGRILASFNLPKETIADKLSPLSPSDRDVVAAAFIAAGGDASRLTAARALVVKPLVDASMRGKHIILGLSTGIAGLAIGVVVGRATKG